MPVSWSVTSSELTLRCSSCTLVGKLVLSWATSRGRLNDASAAKSGPLKLKT